MKADITRDTHRPERHYRRVIHQQGRVPLDADLNEAFAIQDHLDRITARDVIGAVGVPKGDGFSLSVAPGGDDLLIAPGRIYVDGIACELDAEPVIVIGFPAATTIAVPTVVLDGAPLAAGDWVEVFTATGSGVFQLATVDVDTRVLGVSGAIAPSSVAGTGHQLRRRASYARQPDDPAPSGTITTDGIPELALDDGAYLAYLDVWLRHVTALEDPALRESALGGPDTTTRAKVVWQLRLRRSADAHEPVDCQAALPVAPSPAGALAARAKLVPQQTDPCIIDPIAKYRRLSNQLYRVEIHAGGTLGDGTCSFKFSRDNGAVVAAWALPDGPPVADQVVVELPGRDAALELAANQWIELVDDTRELAGTAGTLAQIASVDGNVVTLKSGTATGSTDRADFARNPRVRRWDHVDGPTRLVERPATDDGWLMLEDGVQIRFEPGAYQPGDYWLIPARTINGDVEWPREPDTDAPIARPARGIAHHLAALGVVDVDAGVITVRAPDCRTRFPPLTHIEADDVYIVDDPCGKGYETVQEAIEDLCHARDLEFHNQHLHGWGVVCGLQVTCLRTAVADEMHLERPREHVELADGYAIDPTGADIRIEHDGHGSGVVDLGQLVLDAQIVTRDPEGKIPDTAVSLWIERDGTLHVEPYDPKHKPTALEMLDGTVWAEFYNGCLKPVVDWVKLQISGVPGEAGASGVVTPAQKRLITALNLLAQLLNPTNGRFVYLSGDVDGDPANPNLDKEDGILRSLYAGLRALLQSETFCGMFADIELPPYDVFKDDLDAAAPRPNTIFGQLHHRRIRIDPDGKFAVTCGNGGKLGVYDLEREVMVAVVDFPSANARVVDVAFRKVLFTRQVIAVAQLGNPSDKDSEIVVGTLADDGTITWTNNRVTCSLAFASLATFPGDPARVYGAARGDGVYTILPDSLPKLPERVGAAFAASGPLVAAVRGTQQLLYAGAHGSATFPSTYDRIRQLDVASPGTPVDYLVNGEGHDDVLAVFDSKNQVDAIFAIAGTGGNKRLVRWTFGTPTPVAQSIDLADNTENRLAYSVRTGHLMVTFEDSYQARQYRPVEAALKADRHPLQLGPISAAARPDGTKFYVLNWLSNTITVIPAEYVGADGQQVLEPWQSAIDVSKLALYRQGMINAFLKTLGRFTQYLKDCFCSKLLIDCPDPRGKKVYLADISFKDGAVWQICNFGKRRYVHSFPTVEYWLSIVPVLPFVKRAVEKFCCSVVAGVFDKLQVQPNVVKADKVSLTLAHGAVQALQNFRIKDKVGNVKAQALITSSLASKVVVDKLRRPQVVTATATKSLGATAVLEQPKDAVIADMNTRGISVGEVHVVDGPSAATFARMAIAPPAIPAGSNVDLYVDRSGKVLSYGYAAPATTGLADVRREAEASRADAAASRAEATAARSELAAGLASRDATIAELRGELDTLRTAHAARDAEVANLRGQITELQTTHTRTMTELRTGLETVRRAVEGRQPPR
jgi:hypothetical protein